MRGWSKSTNSYASLATDKTSMTLCLIDPAYTLSKPADSTTFKVYLLAWTGNFRDPLFYYEYSSASYLNCDMLSFKPSFS